VKTHIEKLNDLHACEEAVEWADQFDTIEEVVKNCHRGDWLLWLAHKLNVNLRKLTLTKGHCANTVRHLMTDERSRKAVDVAIKFGRFEVSREKLDAAAAAAYSAAYAAAYAASAEVYDTAAYADAYSAAAAAAAYSAADAKTKNQLQTADICRKYIGNEIIEKFNQLK